MTSVNLDSLGGYHNLSGERRSPLLAHPGDSLKSRISYETLEEALALINRSKLKSKQGDIFMLQLRGHIDVA
jgi:hypothetical protein